MLAAISSKTIGMLADDAIAGRTFLVR